MDRDQVGIVFGNLIRNARVLSNPAAERLFGPLPQGEAGPAGGPPASPLRAILAVSADGDPPLARALRGQVVHDAEVRVRAPDGGEGLWLSGSASPLRDQKAVLKGAVVVYRDVTERKRAEEKLLQQARLVAIGQMMTGLAHESGNALARSRACLEMLQWEVEDRPEALDLIARIQKAQDHLQHLYEEVRNYAAPLKLERETGSSSTSPT